MIGERLRRRELDSWGAAANAIALTISDARADELLRALGGRGVAPSAKSAAEGLQTKSSPSLPRRDDAQARHPD
jgi:hypothetical protein